MPQVGRRVYRFSRVAWIFEGWPTVEHQADCSELFPDEELSCALCGLVEPGPDGCLCDAIHKTKVDLFLQKDFLGHLSDIRASQDMGFHWGEARRARGICNRGSPRELVKFIYGTIERPAKKVKPLKEF